MKRGPVAQADAGVNERNLYQVVQRLFLFFRQFGAEIRDRHVPASQDAAATAQGENILSRRISDLDLARGSFADIANANYGAVQANANRGAGGIQLIVFNRGGNNIVDGISRDGRWNQISSQQTSNGSIAVREVKSVGAAIGVARCGVAHVRSRTRIQFHSLKTGQTEGPTIERRLGINPNSPLAVGAGLVKSDDAGINLGEAKQKILVTDARELDFFL